MKHLKRFNEDILDSKGYGEIRGHGLSGQFGKLLAGISKGVSSLKNKIGKTGNDEDLAVIVLNYLNAQSKAYSKTTDFSKSMVQKPIESNYVIFGKIFPADANTEYRVDIIQASIQKMDYRIIISKIVDKGSGSDFIGLRRSKSSQGLKLPVLKTPNPGDDEKMTQLDCSQQVGKKIFDKAKEIYDLVNKNTKGDARGGLNTNTKAKGKFRSWTW